MALYNDGRGNRLAVSFGSRDADIIGLPPRLYCASPRSPRASRLSDRWLSTILRPS
jgi:hypothetical protein